MKFLILPLFLFSNIAIAYPENTRLGYTSCQSCHVSPTGGGVLTPYGKSTATEMSTWGGESEGIFAHGLFSEINDDRTILVGGDVRYIAINQKSGDVQTHRKFPMQADLELAWQPIDRLTFVGSGGMYGVRRDGEGVGQIEYRRFYAIWNHNQNFSLRAGRFHPAFGIQSPDHTLVTKQALQLGQGDETYNVELTARTKEVEIFFTFIGGKDKQKKGEGFEFDPEEKQGLALKTGYSIGNRSVFGLAYYQSNSYSDLNAIIGAYSIIGFTEDLYWLTDVNYRWLESNTEVARRLAAFSKLGYEVFQGLHLFTRGQYQSEKNDPLVKYGGGIQWFPRPHFELLTIGERTEVGENYSDSLNFIAHYHF